MALVAAIRNEGTDVAVEIDLVLGPGRQGEYEDEENLREGLHGRMSNTVYSIQTFSEL
jgi:hypothetical protein